MRNFLIVVMALVSFAVRADNFRWGDSATSNRIKWDNKHKDLRDDNGRAYLYLGEAKIEKIDEGTTRLSLDGLTYVCDATARSDDDSSFGNYKDKTYFGHGSISADGGQKFSIILVSLCTPTKVKAGVAIEPGPYYSISVKTGTSEAKKDSKGNKYAELVFSDRFTEDDCSMPGEFTLKSAKGLIIFTR